MEIIALTYLVVILIVGLLLIVGFIIIEFNRNNQIITDSIANNTIILNYKYKRSKDTKTIRYKDLKISKVGGGLSILFPYIVENMGYVKRNSRIKKHLDLIFKYGEI